VPNPKGMTLVFTSFALKAFFLHHYTIDLALDVSNDKDYL